ncbi:hypothetical protein ACFQ0M_23535 [Kitasatospora aburaviensis]
MSTDLRPAPATAGTPAPAEPVERVTHGEAVGSVGSAPRGCCRWS